MATGPSDLTGLAERMPPASRREVDHEEEGEGCSCGPVATGTDTRATREAEQQPTQFPGPAPAAGNVSGYRARES